MPKQENKGDAFLMQKSTTQHEEKLRELGFKWSWSDIISYSGDITYEFSTRHLSFLEIAELEAIGMHLGSIEVIHLGDRPYMRVCIEYKGAKA